MPYRPGINPNPDRRSRLMMGDRLCVRPEFIGNRYDIAYDADGDSLLVRTRSCDHEDSFYAIPADPQGRRAPELDGDAPLSVWHACGSKFRDAPAVIGLDLESVDTAELAGCPASMLCAPTPQLRSWTAEDWARELQAGAACEILERHQRAKALILASHPCIDSGEVPFPVLVDELRNLGWYRPILALPKLDLRQFVFTGLHDYDRIMAFLGDIRFRADRVPVPLDDLAPTRLDGRR